MAKPNNYFGWFVKNIYYQGDNAATSTSKTISRGYYYLK